MSRLVCQRQKMVKIFLEKIFTEAEKFVLFYYFIFQSFFT